MNSYSVHNEIESPGRRRFYFHFHFHFHIFRSAVPLVDRSRLGCCQRNGWVEAGHYANYM